MFWAEKPGFCGIQEVNQARVFCYRQAFNLDANGRKNGNKPVTFGRIGYWAAFKGLSVVSIPANIAGVGAGCIGMVATAVVVGGLKIAIYAVTGNKPQFSSGFPECKDRTQHSLGHIKNVLSEQVSEWMELTCFIAGRIFLGLNVAVKGEANFRYSQLKVPFPVNILDRMTAAYRIDWLDSDRSFKQIAMHATLSAINIPANMAAAACSAIAFAFFTSAMSAKAAIYAGTGLEIPVTTFAAKSFAISLRAGGNVYTDARDCAYDVAAALRNVAQAFKVTNVLDKIHQLWIYIPKAMFERPVADV